MSQCGVQWTTCTCARVPESYSKFTTLKICGRDHECNGTISLALLTYFIATSTLIPTKPRSLTLGKQLLCVFGGGKCSVDSVCCVAYGILFRVPLFIVFCLLAWRNVLREKRYDLSC
jgi:hypothetical protein